MQFKTSRRILLFIAAFMWTIAGGVLLFRGLSGGSLHGKNIIFSLFAGGLFYLVLFSRISGKHISRIVNMENDSPSIFSFFSLKSYLVMIVMIACGMILRTSGIISPDFLSPGYIIMGMPLLLSATKFYYHGIIYSGVS